MKAFEKWWKKYIKRYGNQGYLVSYLRRKHQISWRAALKWMLSQEQSISTLKVDDTVEVVPSYKIREELEFEMDDPIAAGHEDL